MEDGVKVQFGVEGKDRKEWKTVFHHSIIQVLDFSHKATLLCKCQQKWQAKKPMIVETLFWEILTRRF